MAKLCIFFNILRQNKFFSSSKFWDQIFKTVYFHFFYVFCAKLKDKTLKAIENRTPVFSCLHHEFYKFFIHFGAFLLLCGLVSIIFTNFFMGLELCLERCDTYGNFGLKKNIFFLWEFSKITHCPPVVTLALLLFVPIKTKGV